MIPEQHMSHDNQSQLLDMLDIEIRAASSGSATAASVASPTGSPTPNANGNQSKHDGKSPYNHPNLAVLIPVIIVLVVLACLIFGAFRWGGILRIGFLRRKDIPPLPPKDLNTDQNDIELGGIENHKGTSSTAQETSRNKSNLSPLGHLVPGPQPSPNGSGDLMAKKPVKPWGPIDDNTGPQSQGAVSASNIGGT